MTSYTPHHLWSSCQGGIGAVVWTDAFQSVIMLLGQVFICTIGVSKVGGINEVYDAVKKLNRFNFDK